MLWVAKKRIHRGYYTVRRRYEFYFPVAKQYFTNERSEWVIKYCFWHEQNTRVYIIKAPNFISTSSWVWILNCPKFFQHLLVFTSGACKLGKRLFSINLKFSLFLFPPALMLWINPSTASAKWYSLIAHFNFWVCGQTPVKWPFKWKLFSSTFTCYYLFCM